MALFKSKEEKQEKLMQDFMDKYQLDNINENDLEIIKRISSDLAANGLFKIGMALSMAKAEEQAKVTYLSALVDQNWMIIRQLSNLNDKIEKMEKK